MMKLLQNKTVYRQAIYPLLILLGSATLWTLACSPPNTCQTDYNCPQGQYCVKQLCQSQQPPGYKPPSWEAPPWVEQDGGSHTETPPKPKAECQKRSDCKDPNKPYCFQQRCTPGYFSFDFQGGHVIIAPEDPTKRCKKKEDCQKWQQCHLAYCRNTVGLKSKAEGKVGQKVFFMDNYSYSALTKRKVGDSVEIIQVGAVSAKLQYRLVITMPLKGFVLGKHAIDGQKITAHIYEVRTELTPVRQKLLGVAVEGTVKIYDAGYLLGQKISGLADLFMQPVE